MRLVQSFIVDRPQKPENGMLVHVVQRFRAMRLTWPFRNTERLRHCSKGVIPIWYPKPDMLARATTA